MRWTSVAYLFLPVLFTACFVIPGDDAVDDNDFYCPSGEQCSTKTPYGLHFTLPSLFKPGWDPYQDPAVAIGGTMDIQLAFPTRGGNRPLDLPYRAIANGPFTVAATSGPVVTIAGVQTGKTMLRIVDATDGALFGLWPVQSAAVAKVEVIPEIDRGTAIGRPVAFTLGAQRIGVQILDGAARRLVDSSMKLTLDGATQTAWDTLTASVMTPGVRTLTASLGTEAPRTFEVPFVDHADSLELFFEPPIYVDRNHTERECFYPVSDGHYVVATAADWSFSVDAGSLRNDSNALPGCVEITPTQLGMLHLTANALGASKTITIFVNF